MHIKIDRAVREYFSGLEIRLIYLAGVNITKSNPDLEDFKKQVLQTVSKNYRLETLKDSYLFRIYRDFFWRIGIDPTKTRPAAEALIRRVLAGKLVPKINTFVDAYNLASINTGIPLAAFDADTVGKDLVARFAEPDEEFFGIGMVKSMRLKGKEIVVGDGEKLIAVYPHRDSNETKILESTCNVLLMTCGAPGVGEEILVQAEETAISYILRFCNGQKKI